MVQQRVGVDAVLLEESMLAQRQPAAAGLVAAQPVLHLDSQQRVDEDPPLVRDEPLLDLKPAAHDVLEHLELGDGDEGRLQVDQLVREHAEAPPVHKERVAVPQDDLGREVLGRAADGPRALVRRDDLGEAKVDNLEVAVLVDEQILGLEVAVGDEVVVQVLEGEGDVGRVEGDVRLRELAALALDDIGEHREELSPLNEVEEQVEVLRVLEGATQLEQEGVVADAEQVTLLLDVLRLVLGEDVLLRHHLERIARVGLLPMGELDTAVAADAEGLDHREFLEVGGVLDGLTRAAVDADGEERVELGPVEGDDLGLVDGGRVERSLLNAHERLFAKIVAGAKFAQRHVDAVDLDADLDLALADDEQRARLRPLLPHHLPLAVLLHLEHHEGLDPARAVLGGEVDERLLRVGEGVARDLVGEAHDHRFDGRAVELEEDHLTDGARRLVTRPLDRGEGLDADEVAHLVADCLLDARLGRGGLCGLRARIHDFGQVCAEC
mmetsp:Transcript_24197/g.63890  ORF Transcript_24197/g.63890 Transcript_24197/m.63890 type:complete len:496 (-) Transcript_24197:329-1816(-)